MLISLKPYVVRFVSTHRKAGKTSIASSVVKRLKEEGYKVAVVKHVAHEITVEDKDTTRYIKAGADTVVAISDTLVARYERQLAIDLARVIENLDSFIIVVEGFKGSGIGDVIAVANTPKELEELLKIEKNVIGVMGLEGHSSQSYKLLTVEEAAKLIESRALEHLLNQLPKADCGMCGHSSCKSLAQALLKGVEAFCPRLIEVKLTVNNRLVVLNPFVKRLLVNILLAFIDSLKGVKRPFKHILVEVGLD